MIRFFIERSAFLDAIVACFIFSKILKIELSPGRELNFGNFKKCFCRNCWIPKILKSTVLRAWEYSFEDVHALNPKPIFFCNLMKISVFTWFFHSFGHPGGILKSTEKSYNSKFDLLSCVCFVFSQTVSQSVS